MSTLLKTAGDLVALVRQIAEQFGTKKAAEAALVQCKIDQAALQAVIVMLIRNGALTAWEVDRSLSAGYAKAIKDLQEKHEVAVPQSHKIIQTPPRN